MHIMITVTYPPDKLAEIAQLFETLPSLPDSVKNLGIYGTADGVVKSYSIYEISDSDVEAGLTGLRARMHGYHVVEGFRWRIELVSRVNPS